MHHIHFLACCVLLAMSQCLWKCSTYGFDLPSTFYSTHVQFMCTILTDLSTLRNRFFFFFSFFSTGLVRLYIAGFPLRFCRTIGAPSVPNVRYFVHGSSGTHVLTLTRRTFYRYAMLTPPQILRMIYKLIHSIVKQLHDSWGNVILKQIDDNLLFKLLFLVWRFYQEILLRNNGFCIWDAREKV